MVSSFLYIFLSNFYDNFFAGLFLQEYFQA